MRAPHRALPSGPVNTVRADSSVRFVPPRSCIGVVSVIVCSPFVHHLGRRTRRRTAAPRHRQPATLPSALTGIQAAFLSNDASRLARWFPRRGPVFVSVPPLEPGRSSRPGPLKAFLDRAGPRARLRRRWNCPRCCRTSRSGRPHSTFVKVKWTHRPPASGTLQVDYLHLALRYAPDDGEWRIVEIKTSLR